jgi:hypothetical protein
MEFLNRAVDSFIASGSDESSAWDVPAPDVENPTGGRRVPKSTGLSPFPEHVRPIEMIWHSASGDSVDGRDHTSTESETSDSSLEEGQVDPHFFTSPVILTSRPEATTEESGKTSTTRSKGEVESFHDENLFMWFPHGTFWTLIGFFFAWAGVVCSYEARNTFRFVTVDSPIYVDTNFEEVYEVGMINFQLCFNETHTGMSGCTIHELASTDVNDKMFQIARSMAFLAILLGGFLAASITIATFWSTINLIPIGFGFLLTYFIQTLTFLLFDSELCALHQCHMAKGTIHSLIGSMCWILASIASARMDAFKYRRIMAKALSRKASSQRLKQSNLNRGISDITQRTEMSRVGRLPGRTSSSSRSLSECQPRKIPPFQEISMDGRNERKTAGGRPLLRSEQGAIGRPRRASASPLRPGRKSTRTQGRPFDWKLEVGAPRNMDEARRSKYPTKEREISESKRQGVLDARKYEL